MRELSADIAIIGGGVGGCAAALAAARMGKSIILTEETDWVGGQFTSQAVPPDENRWIEKFGSTQLYRNFRNRIRDYYQRNFPLSAEAATQCYFNPGNGYVSRLCHDPRVTLAVYDELLAPYLHNGLVTLLLHHKAHAVEVQKDRIQTVVLKHVNTGNECVIHAQMFLDATELGDLLPLSGTEYVTGAESQYETGEMHAPAGPPQPLNMQAITFCFAMDHLPGEDHTIDCPEKYSFWRDYVPELRPAWPGKLLSWKYPSPTTLATQERMLMGGEHESLGFWRYRRIVDHTNFVAGTFPSDITTVNWPQNDYFLGPVHEVDQNEAAKHLEGARQLSLSLLYWMQTEAPRPDGGTGYPGLRLRPDVVGTADGLAKYPYIRESRRIKAQFTVLEEHIGQQMRGNHKAALFEDSVGIGHYNIDLHPSTGGDNYIDVPSNPFQIPLGSLIPIRMQNLLPACKNIGTTHVTSGCYRLHPVEWNIGESAGYLAGFCLSHNTMPEAVRSQPLLQEFQHLLEWQGVELSWPNIGP